MYSSHTEDGPLVWCEHSRVIFIGCYDQRHLKMLHVNRFLSSKTQNKTVINGYWELWSKPILNWRTYASGFLLQSCDVSLLSKGQFWSVCMKLKQAATIQRKVRLMVAAEERGTATAGGALHVFASNGPFTLKLNN